VVLPPVFFGVPFCPFPLPPNARPILRNLVMEWSFFFPPRPRHASLHLFWRHSWVTPAAAQFPVPFGSDLFRRPNFPLPKKPSQTPTFLLVRLCGLHTSFERLVAPLGFFPPLPFPCGFSQVSEKASPQDSLPAGQLLERCLPVLSPYSNLRCLVPSRHPLQSLFDDGSQHFTPRRSRLNPFH